MTSIDKPQESAADAGSFLDMLGDRADAERDEAGGFRAARRVGFAVVLLAVALIVFALLTGADRSSDNAPTATATHVIEQPESPVAARVIGAEATAPSGGGPDFGDALQSSYDSRPGTPQ